MSGWLWILIDIVGPLLLIGAIVWVYLRNRKTNRSEIARAEEGAKQVREDIRRDPEYREE